MRTVLPVIALVSASLASPTWGQTLEEVRQAVDHCVGLNEEAESAREQLTRWGNAALPFLRELAGKPEDSTLIDRLSPLGYGSVRLVCAIQLVDTPEAVDFLVEILDRKTQVAPHYALTLMRASISKHGEQMRSHVRLKQL